MWILRVRPVVKLSAGCTCLLLPMRSTIPDGMHAVAAMMTLQDQETFLLCQVNISKGASINYVVSKSNKIGNFWPFPSWNDIVYKGTRMTNILMTKVIMPLWIFVITNVLSFQICVILNHCLFKFVSFGIIVFPIFCHSEIIVILNLSYPKVKPIRCQRHPYLRVFSILGQKKLFWCNHLLNNTIS